MKQFHEIYLLMEPLRPGSSNIEWVMGGSNLKSHHKQLSNTEQYLGQLFLCHESGSLIKRKHIPRDQQKLRENLRAISIVRYSCFRPHAQVTWCVLYSHLYSSRKHSTLFQSVSRYLGAPSNYSGSFDLLYRKLPYGPLKNSE